MRVIDVHGAHVVDFERYHLDQGDTKRSRDLGYSILDFVHDAEKFLRADPQNRITVLPNPFPIFESFKHSSGRDFDIYPYFYENTQVLQALTFMDKIGLGERVFPFFGISPGDAELKGYADYLRALVKKTRGGLKFHPLALNMPISSLSDSPFLDLAKDQRMPVLVHTGRDKYSDSRQLVPIARENRAVNFCAAHFGYFRREFLEAVSGVPNLFLDTSILSALFAEIKEGNPKHVNLADIPESVRTSSNSEIFGWLVDTYGLEDKLLFGSDMKWTRTVGSSRGGEIKFAEDLKYTKEKKNKWMYSNALRFLGIE